jgi:hypothetical protein
MTKPFHILLVFLSLLIGLQALISCSEDIDTIDIGTNSSVSPSSSSIAESSSSGNNSSDSSISSSSEETLPLPAIDLPISGHKPSGLSIIIPPETEHGIVRCETSGTAPNENSSIQSGSTLNLTQNAILRCAYFKEGKIASKTILRTYIIERLPDLPIVSIAVDPMKMFGNNPKGIYKNDYKPDAGCSGGSFYSDEEIPIYVDFFEKGANLAWSYPAGIHIHGGCSRQWPKKSVIVSFREEYGQKNLNYPLFPEHLNLTKFKHFMLRNNGNNYDNDYIRDMLMSSLTEGLDIDYQKGRSVVVYYNGQYYGIHNLRERANSDYFETNYKGINEDNIDLVKVEKYNGAPEEVSKGSDDDYQDIISWLNSGVSLADDENFKKLEKRIDVDNLTNHFQSRIFYKDCDWPGKNMKRWRNNLTRSKWRWLLYDTDHGFGSWGVDHLGSRSMMDFITATNGPYWPNPPHSTFLLRKLLENQSYKNAFINRFSLLIATYFTTERINSRINELMAQIESEIMYDKQRWTGRNFSRDLPTITSFGSSRPSSMQSEIGNYWNLGIPVNLTLSVNGGGKILVHDLPLPNWNPSVTFKVYPSIPITIKAEGAGFKGWSDGVTAAERTIPITQATILTANF